MNRQYPELGSDAMVVVKSSVTGLREVMIGTVIPDPQPMVFLSVEPRTGGIWRIQWEHVLLID